MARMPIHNETDYALTAPMQQNIIRDAHEHFGEDVRSIRVQAGLERHAFNARTHEVRYAFSPMDFGLVPTLPAPPETPRARRQSPRRDEAIEHEFLPTPREDSAVDAEEPAPHVRSLARLEAGDDDENEEALFTEDADVFRLDDQTEDEEDDEDEAGEDDEDEEDDEE